MYVRALNLTENSQPIGEKRGRKLGRIGRNSGGERTENEREKDLEREKRV